MIRKLKSKDIDLLVVYKKRKEPSKYASLIKYVAPPLCGALIIFLVFGVLSFQNWRMNNEINDTKKQIQEVKDKIANDPNLEKVNSLQTLQANTEKYKKLYSNMQSYPQISQNTFDQILLASGLNVDVVSLSYSRGSSVITLEIEAPNASDAELFVRRVKNTGVFSAVQYSGYSRVEKKSENVDTTPTNPVDDEEKSDIEKLADLINSKKNASDSTTSYYVYTATILCTLK